jgi:hypothetical protein
LAAGDFAYIKDVRDDLPISLTSQGLSELLECRPETRSEVCLPIYKTGLKIGVLNIESGDDNAFYRDLKFIKGLAHQIGDFVDIITRSSDAGWLPRLSFMQFATHGLGKLRVSLEAYPEALNAVSGALEKMSVDYIDPDNQTAQPTDVLLASIEGFTTRILADRRKSWQEVLNVSGEVPKTISTRQAHSLEVILENLIENTRSHDSMRWAISLVFDRDASQARRLIISYAPPEVWLLPEDTDRFGVAPRWDAARSIYHLGMFLAGVHVRLLGGVMWVDQTRSETNGSVAFRYVIQIPLEPSSDQEMRMDTLP